MKTSSKNKAGMGMVAGFATLLFACFGVTNTASGIAVSPPDNQTALLTIQGQGVTPDAKISLSTGPQQTITAIANKEGQFVFSNLKYASYTNLYFKIDIPPFKKGLAKNYAPSQLEFRYNTQAATVTMAGLIGKSGTLAFNLGGADNSIVQSAGSDGYVRLQARTSAPMVGGQSAISASIINTAEVCCPTMILPSSPVTLTILSQPVAMAPPQAVPPSNPARVPAANIPVPAPAPVQKKEKEATSPAKAQPQKQQQPANPTPYIILPKKDGETAPQNEKKPQIPYIIQGRVDIETPTIISDDLSAISFGSGSYDSTYNGGIKKDSTETMNSTLMHIGAFGGFLDGRNLMDALRALQLSTARTLKDYTPSDSICRFGTLTRSVALASATTEKNQMSFSKLLQDRHSQKEGSVYGDAGSGLPAILTKFRKKYCDKKDTTAMLENYCETSSATADQLLNRDVNFTRVFDVPLTFDADFTSNTSTNDRESLIALFDSLSYVPPVMSSGSAQFEPRNDAQRTQNLRALASMKSVTANSFGALVGEKAKSSAQAASHMHTMLQHLGLSAADATKLLGANPSYFAQMEVLTKKLFQSPAFYGNLYESEANIDRQRVAMKAIELQQDRDFLESLRRREMLLSVLLNAKLNRPMAKANETGIVTK